MKQARRAIAALTLLLMLGGAPLLTRSVLADGLPLSHLGQPIQDHVTLVNAFQHPEEVCSARLLGSAGFADQVLVRMSPNGTLSPDKFQVPNGRILVITDITWSTFATLGDPLIVGTTLSLGLSLVRPESSATVASADETIDTAEGRPGASVHLVSGVAVGPGSEICPSAVQASPQRVIAVKLARVIINGYLIDAPRIKLPNKPVPLL